MKMYSLFVAAVIFIGGLWFPVSTGPMVDASSTLIASTYEDFNETGALFDDTLINGTGVGAALELHPYPDGEFKNMTSSSPAMQGRSGYGIATICGKDLVMMFGGTGPSEFNDTWLYDVKNNQWASVAPSTSFVLRPRDSMGIASITGDDNVVMFGGSTDDDTTILNETLIFDFTNSTWSNVSVAGPRARYQLSMASDFTSKNIVLFGGRSDPDGYNFSDTWIYNGTSVFWMNITPPTSPPGRCGHMMAGVTTDDKIVLFGGINNDQTFNDTWVYDIGDNKWTNKTPASPPPARSKGALVPVHGDDKVVLFGGARTGVLNDTWVYDVGDNKWSQKSPATAPSGRGCVSAAALFGTDKAVLFGGNDTDGCALNDTWVYNLVKYPAEGEYLSAPHDTGGCSNFMTLNLTVNQSAGSEIGVQLRTASSEANLSQAAFAGPDGTSSTYYATNGSVRASHDGDRWVQYRVRLKTGDTELTPALKDISLSYNRFPEAPAAIQSDGFWSSNNRPGFNWTFADNDSAGQAAFEWCLDGSPDFSSLDMTSGVVASPSQSYTPPSPVSDGLSYWRVRAKDTDGDWGPYSSAASVRVDAGAPNGFTPVPSATGWTNDNVTVTFATTDATSGIECYRGRVDGGPFTCQTSPWTLTLTSDRVHQVVIRAYDLAGNYVDGTVDVKVDLTPPEPFLLVPDTTDWTSGSMNVSFETSDATSGIDRYEGKIDGGAFVPCASPWPLTDIANGSHNITVCAFDKAGNHAESCCTVHIDNSGPAPFAAAVSPAGWTCGPVIVTFSTTDEPSGVVGYYARIDGGGSMAAASPWTLPSLADGPHNITVGAIDAAGNTGESTVCAYIDRTAPQKLNVTATPGCWTSQIVTVNFSAEDKCSGLDSFRVQVDKGDFTVATSPLSYSDLPDGIHNITVRARDKAGNLADATVQAFIDRSAPSPFSPLADQSTWTKNRPRITFSATDGVSGIHRYEIGCECCPYCPCSSPFTPMNMTDGIHNMTVRAYDQAGNCMEGKLKVMFDHLPPSAVGVTINLGADKTEDRKVSLGITAADAHSGVYQICLSNDGTSYSQWETYSGTKAWELSAGEGVKKVFVKVRDVAGNEATASATISLRSKSGPDQPAAGDGLGGLAIPLVGIIVVIAAAVGIYAIKGRKPAKTSKTSKGRTPPRTPSPSPKPKAPAKKTKRAAEEE